MIRKVVAILSLVFIGYSSYAVHLVRDTLPSGILSDLNFTEICDNGIDDDADGYVDNYDIDCPCSDSLFNAKCDGACQAIEIDTSFKMKLKWKSDVIGTSLNKILCFDTIIYTRKVEGGFSFFNPDSENSVVSINGYSGSTISSLPFTSKRSWASDSESISIFKWRDTILTIVLHRDTLLLFDFNGNKRWESYGFGFLSNAGINLIDLNLDGIPEIQIANKIISVINGQTLIEDTVLKGYNTFGTWFPIGKIPSDWIFHSNCIAADLLPSAGLEIAAGDVVYEVVLNNNLSKVGNQFIPYKASLPVKNGITSVGDIDGDGELDVIVVRNAFYIDGGGYMFGILAQE